MVERSPYSLGEQPGARPFATEPKIGRSMLTTTQRMSQWSQYMPQCMAQCMSCATHGARMGGRRARIALVLIAGAALAACQTVTGSPTTEAEDNLLAASPANIASLSGVVQNN